MSKYLMDGDGYVTKDDGDAALALAARRRPVLMVDPSDNDQIRRIAAKAGASMHLVWNLVQEMIEEDHKPPMEEPTAAGSMVSARIADSNARFTWVRIHGCGNAPWAYGGRRVNWNSLIDPVIPE